MSSTTKYIALPIVGLWPLLRLHWGWAKYFGPDITSKVLNNAQQKFGGLNLCEKLADIKFLHALDQLSHPVHFLISQNFFSLPTFYKILASSWKTPQIKKNQNIRSIILISSWIYKFNFAKLSLNQLILWLV